MLSIIATFTNRDGLRSTPQYEFSRGISEFKQEGYNTTVSELSNNLIGMNAVDMLDKKQITKDICITALSYLMFLKRKRTGDVKERGCTNCSLNVSTSRRKNLACLLYTPMRCSYHALWMIWILRKGKRMLHAIY